MKKITSTALAILSIWLIGANASFSKQNQLIALLRSDLVDTCWTFTEPKSPDITYTFEFYADGTYKQYSSMFGNDSITEGEWRMDSGKVFMRSIRYKFLSSRYQSDWSESPLEHQQWSEHFISIQNGQLIQIGGFAYDPC